MLQARRLDERPEPPDASCTLYAIAGLLVGALAVTVSVYLFIDGAAQARSGQGRGLLLGAWQIIIQVPHGHPAAT